MKNMRKWFVLAMCMLATSSLFSQQNDWAQFGRYAEANKSVETPTRVVFMGNSITDGWWNTDSLFFQNNRYIGRGIGGQTTAQMLVRFRADVIDLQPKDPGRYQRYRAEQRLYRSRKYPGQHHLDGRAG